MSNTDYQWYNPNRANRWEDWANLALAVWFFFSPWILAFGTGTAAVSVGAVSNAAWDAWVLSVIVFLIALSAIGRMEFWQEWINLFLGAWIFAAPWALGFASAALPAASWDHWIVGALIFLFSAVNIASVRSIPGQRTSYHAGPRP